MTAAVPALRSEGTIALIAPTPALAVLDVEKAGQWMRTRGYDLREFPPVSMNATATSPAVMQYVCVTARRFADPEIDAIFCLRGGYGTATARRAGLRPAARQPSPFVGYSDITALHLAISRYAGFVTFNPMLNADLQQRQATPTESSLFNLLQGQLGAGSVLVHPVAYPLTTIEPGIACGAYWGATCQ